MNNFTFVIIDDDQKNGMKTRVVAESFQHLTFLAAAATYEDGIDCVLEHNPDIIFLEIDPADKDSNLSLGFINELHRYLKVVPKIFVTTKNDALCLDAFKYGVFDYFLHPLETKELRKAIFRLDKEFVRTEVLVNGAFEQTVASKPVNVETEVLSPTFEEKLGELTLKEEESDPEDALIVQEIPTSKENDDETNSVSKEVTFIQETNAPNKPLTICVKSYGDYRYIDATDIAYLQADNNSTDIHLNSGEMITAFKTLKHFESVMTYPFVRIHNSYIVNIEYISRIHTGNAVCHIKNTTTKLPFSKSYKENIDAIITSIASGNYLEI